MLSLKIPINTNIKLELTDAKENEPTNEDAPYMNMVGALRYAADCTRPDISFTTSLLARFLQNPSNEHYNTVKHCFGYLKRTKDYWLTLGGDSDVHFVHGFSDADGMNQEGYKAISGYVFQLGKSTIS